MINPHSRYTSGTQTRMPNSGGVYNLSVLRTVQSKPNNPYVQYIWRSGDRPDLVAAELLGDPTLWWSIFDINPEIIYPLNVPPGTLVRVPVVPVEGQGTLVQ